MKFTQILATIVLSLAVAFGVQHFYGQGRMGGAASPKTETAYERVMRTGTIRCGYALWSPYVIKDPNTKAMSGIYVDYMDAMGKALDLKVEWVAEVGYGDFIEGLRNNRFDVMCYVWANPNRAKYADFISPISYSPMVGVARVDDRRFDDGYAKLNSPDFVVATIDGEVASLVVMADFPKAKTLSLPQLSDVGMAFTNVASSKADITFAPSSAVREFMDKNPGKIKVVRPNAPVRLGFDTAAVKKGEYDLVNMLNGATEELLSSGVVDRIIAKYEKYPNTIYRPAPPYKWDAAPSK